MRGTISVWSHEHWLFETLLNKTFFSSVESWMLNWLYWKKNAWLDKYFIFVLACWAFVSINTSWQSKRVPKPDVIVRFQLWRSETSSVLLLLFGTLLFFNKFFSNINKRKNKAPNWWNSSFYGRIEEHLKFRSESTCLSSSYALNTSV